MKPDPKVRRDGKCTVCQSPRMTWRSKKYAGLKAENDPFARRSVAGSGMARRSSSRAKGN
jgi:hypothetical protein